MPRRTTTRRLRAASAAPTAGLLAAALLLGGAGTAVADGSPSQDAAAGGGTGPAEAGTGFRTATPLGQGERAMAAASTGDYLYWVFPAGAGQDATVQATVSLPEVGTRHGPVTWRLDVHDGLRRRQPCVEGRPSRRALRDTDSVTLTCTLPTVRPWAEPWEDAPLPGAYYVRLTAVEIPEEDLGLPVRAEVVVTAAEADGSRARGGGPTAPLLPVLGAGTAEGGTGGVGEEAGEAGEGTAEGAEVPRVALDEPEGGWSGGWWSDRWAWTAAGGVLGALAGVAGHALARRSGSAAARRS